MKAIELAQATELAALKARIRPEWILLSAILLETRRAADALERLAPEPEPTPRRTKRR